ncbi:MAG: glycosyltransferase family 2 protein [Nitritalea sp.]
MKPGAIVLLNFNGEKVLPDFLPSVLQESSLPIYVIDNGSSDGSGAYLRMYEAEGRLTVLPLADNFGFAEGYNQGLTQLKGQYRFFILLNTDVRVTPGWDLQLLQFLEQQGPQAFAVQPKILDAKKPDYFEYAGAAGGYLDQYGFPFCRGRVLTHCEQDLGQYADPVTVDWCSGACMAVEAASFFSLGGFDADYFAHMEEIDLCWRARNAGLVLWCLPAVRVYHQGGATLAVANPKKTFLNIRNSLLMLMDRSSIASQRRLWRARQLFDLLAMVHFLFQGKWAQADAVRAGRKAAVQLLQKRPAPPKHLRGPISQREPVLRSIILARYLKGSRTYPEL